ncbi:lectin-like domain-containing protein [Paenibacillus apiarius]|uniref:lectin-like domain-containing protein n=1 Tax=Paenibacillus apiarius TaxID=46240 RepID=UPI003B3A9D8A
MKKIKKIVRPKLLRLLAIGLLLPSLAWMSPVRGEATNANPPDGIESDTVLVAPPDSDSSVTDVTYVTYATYNRSAMTRNANVPPASITLENIFTIPTGSNSSVINNSIVEITPNATWQKGGIWSTPNNLMDLTQDFTASMYLYFGNARGNAADGIAFVMHNDPRGTNALSPNAGGSLGVWASWDHNGPYNGIQKSLAIEFDTYINNNLGDGWFDYAAANGNHVAWNYPGKSSSYNDFYEWLVYKRQLHHKDLQYTGTLSDDTWRKLEVNWSVANKQLTYHLQGTNPMTIPIDVQDVFGADQVYWGFTGSTGAKYAQNRVVFESVPGLVDGEAKEAITRKGGYAVEQGASVYKAEELTYTITAKYLSGKQNWKNIIAQTSINDHVTYVPNSSTLTDRNGTAPLADSNWSGNTLAVPLQDMSADNNEQTISFKVTVKDVSQPTPVTEKAVVRGSNYILQASPVDYVIQSNQVPEVTINEAGPVHIAVGEDYEATGTWKDIDNSTDTLYYSIGGKLLASEVLDNGGAAEPMAWSYLIASDQLTVGEHQFQVIARDDDGAYSLAVLTIIVDSPPAVTLMDAGQENPVDAGSEYNMTGHWIDLDSAAVDLYYAIDGNEPVNFAPQAANSANKGEEVAYQYAIPAAQLPLGTHQIAVHAIDDTGRQSNVEIVTVHVTGKLVFTTASENISFENIKISSQPSWSKRNSDWDIRVKDTRGLGSSWRLSATLTEPFTDDKGNELKDALIFVDENGNETTMEPGMAAYVFEKVTQDQQEVSINWETNQGILLKINPYAYAGKYKGLISWNLVDAP